MFGDLSERQSDRRLTESGGGPEHRLHERRNSSLDWIALFKNADALEVREALRDCEVLELSAGSAVLSPGQANDHAYILLSGELAAFLSEEVRADQAIAFARGDCVGELSVIDGKPASALVLALSSVRLLKISKPVFCERLLVIPQIASNLMMSLTERMRRSNEQALKAQREQLELEHLRKELSVARQLQTSMLPLQRPLFADRQDIDICGFMEPASVVGGDLFDAFFLDDRRLFFCVGDVSGHGIAAALFMARAIGLIRVLATQVEHPDELLGLLNERLCIDNDANIFVTLFCGTLDVPTGILNYSNGGHCAPMLVLGDSSIELPIPKGALVGAFPGLKYQRMTHRLQEQQTLFCYTDGVTEAQNAAGDEFGEQRCQMVLNRSCTETLPKLLDDVRSAVKLHTGADTLEDDCTMLALRLAARPLPA